MGMVYVLRRATDDQLATLMRCPDLVSEFLREDEPSAGDQVDVDKAWHLIHFVLAGSANPTGGPLSFLVEDWPTIGEVAVGWGPPQAIGAAAMKRFEQALRGVKDDEITARYRSSMMLEEDVYLADAFDGADEGGVGYVLEHLPTLRAFTSDCVALNCGAVAYQT